MPAVSKKSPYVLNIHPSTHPPTDQILPQMAKSCEFTSILSKQTLPNVFGLATLKAIGESTIYVLLVPS